MDGSRTERETGMSSMDNDWQSPAKPATSKGGMVLQGPAKPAGSIGERVVLAVGIWYVTLSWRGLPVVKSARGGRCWRPGASAMGYGFMCRETWWRDWRLALRGDLHPWRGGTGEDNLAGGGMVCWPDGHRHKKSGTCQFGPWTPKWASRGCSGWSWG